MEKESQQKSNTALREEAVLAFWKERNIFEKAVAKDAPKGEFVFFEGPPTANAKPALHHLEARAFKDVIPRYKTMQGYHVPRRAGWDTHGLPVELQIEKKLGLQSKKDIETYGIAAFNKECKDSVFTYIKDWEVFTDRIGYWVDKKNAYYTFNADYMESLWNIVGRVNDQGLLYKDYKVVPWCPRCGTGLSSHELAQGYADVKDLSVYAKFKIVGTDNGYFVAWTTTPWTLPGNVALAVGKDIEYVEAKVGDDILVLAKDRLSLLTEQYEIIAEHKGSEMAGMAYEPLYPFLAEQIPDKEKLSSAYKVYTADFVTTTDGTGIVHTAVMYGQDDFELGTKIGLPKFHTVAEDGHFIPGTGFLEGRFVKDEEVAVDIIKDLAHRGLLFKKEKYEHSYPHCWRCKTPLIYYARDSWYIGMSQLQKELIAANESINWEPDHIKDGRFGEWIKEVKDWAISRERYWGTPLPIWLSADGDKIVADSVETIKKYIQRSGNRYLVMRHGEGEHNVQQIYSSDPNKYHLTEKGISQASASARLLKDKHIDVIYRSPFLRTKETAEIVAKEISLSAENIIIDERLRELEFGDFSERPINDYWKFADNECHGFDTKIPNGESYQDAKNRFGSFLYEIDQKHQGKNILIITHGIGLEVIPSVIALADQKRSMEIFNAHVGNAPGSFLIEEEFLPLPHNDSFELDLHRPYIDSVILEKDGKVYRRVKEVMDVWFDSGSMPFAQDHYPFEHKEWIDSKGYPADFISEAIDQTRGWFYTLLAVGVLMERGTPYKNVICLGHLLDKEGKKMSKSIGNIVEPFEQMDKFGVDAVRFWMYSVNAPGESKNYDEKNVAEINNKVFNLYYNVLSFYELYRDIGIEENEEVSTNILDAWIIARLNQLIAEITHDLDRYDLFHPTRAIRDFMDDLSTWYLRRSRERIKDGDTDAKRTLYIVLKTLAKLMAPFAPFMAEDVWQKLRFVSDEESVHLASWPIGTVYEQSALDEMQKVRDLCTLGNAERKKIGIPVRQPLQSYAFLTKGLDSYYEIIKDELNVKEIVIGDAGLNSAITPELKVEGEYREFVRAVQDLRKAQNLSPSDMVSITISPDAEEFIAPFLSEFKKTVQATSVSFVENDGQEVKVGELIIRVTMQK